MLRSSALIEAWFDTLTPVQRELARGLREAILAAAPALEVSIKWGNLVFSVQRTHALAIVVYREHIDLQVFNGVHLAARHPALAGSGKTLRHLRLRLGLPLDADYVQELVRDCVAEMAP
jgi:hypothetical protein